MTTDILAKLRDANSDEEREWIVLDMLLGSAGTEAREGYWAAAFPGQEFDDGFLTALLEGDGIDTSGVLEKLVSLGLVGKNIAARRYGMAK